MVLLGMLASQILGTQYDALFHGSGEASAVRCWGQDVTWSLATLADAVLGAALAVWSGCTRTSGRLGAQDEGVQESNLESMRPGSQTQSQDARRLQGYIATVETLRY
jgi:uncharacterized protein with LGFP repeats